MPENASEESVSACSTTGSSSKVMRDSVSEPMGGSSTPVGSVCCRVRLSTGCCALLPAKGASSIKASNAIRVRYVCALACKVMAVLGCQTGS